MRCFCSTGLIGLTTLTLPMWALPGQGSTNFQVSLTIVARPPPHKVNQQVTSNAWPGDPPCPMFNQRVMTKEKSGAKLVVITTEF